MPSRRSSSDLILFSSQDPEPLVRWLIDNHGLQAILQVVAEYRPLGTTTEAPAKRASKKRASKKGGSKKGSKKGGKKLGRPKGSKNASKKSSKKGSAKKGGKKAQGTVVGNG